MGKSTGRKGKSLSGKKLHNIPIPKKNKRKFSLVSDSSDSSLSDVSIDDSDLGGSSDDDDDSSDDDDDVDYVKMTASKKLALNARRKKPVENVPPKPEVLSEEDLGEEVSLSIPQHSPFKEEESLLEVPKIDETELNSDDDYELDKEKLIDTLQNDNDEVEIFGKSDDDLDFFLSGGQDIEEENYLLAEEADAILKDYSDPEVIGHGESAGATSEANNNNNDNNTTSAVEDGEVKKEPGNETKHERYDYDDYDSSDEMDDEYDEFSDEFEMPWYDVFQNSAYHSSRHRPSVDSEDDDSYLWPYFLSGESSEDDEDDKGKAEKSDKKDAKDAKVEDDSGDSTDEDTTLPPPSTKKIGSKSAKEILSSSKNNFRAPVLGVWTTTNQAKPFGIIDGFSTRSLEPAAGSRGGTRIVSNPKPKFQQGASGASGQPIMELDELLYVDEFEEGDEDVSKDVNDEWERKVPLSAFRSKGLVDGVPGQPVRRFSSSFGERRARLKDKKPKKQGGKTRTDEVVITPVKSMKLHKIRKKKKEALRSTKGGLFSESTLADVEALLVDLGDDDDFDILFGA